MYLKSMEICGFKSFPDKTKIIFERGVTAVVGPNGCGKSNIVDSIKWVLGEKKAKNLRGDKMEDVIFNGTETRRPISMAEVSIAIENQNRILNFDSDVVVISRRLYRDGESEYLINKSPVRLKDLDQLLMDTGMGKSSYSVMEQGKIDLILSTKAEDRRVIFEEAAGISKFKFQRRESLKKLQDASDNLERINDIINEIEREKNQKAKQAEKTEQYRKLNERLKDRDIKLNLIRYSELSIKKNKCLEDLERLKKKREEISSKVSVISSENEKDEKEKNDIQLQLFELDKELHTYKIKVEDIDGKTSKNRKLIEEYSVRIGNIEKNIKEREDNLQRLENEKARSEQKGMEQARRIEEDKNRLKSMAETRSRKIASIKSAKENIEKNRENISSSEERISALREKTEVVIKMLVDAIERRKAELLESENERAGVRSRIMEQLEQFRKCLEEAVAAIRAGDYDGAAGRLADIDLSSLEKNIHTFEGFEDGFRSIMFDKSGVMGEKEELDSEIRRETEIIESCKKDIELLEQQVRNGETELEDISQMIFTLEKDITKNENDRIWIEKNIESLLRQIEDIKKQIGNYQAEINHSKNLKDNLKKEIDEWEGKLVEFNENSQTLKKDIDMLAEKRLRIDNRVSSRKSISKKDQEDLSKAIEKIGEQERALVEHDFRINTIEEYLWTEYEKKPQDYKAIDDLHIQYPSIQKDIQELKHEIQELGPINNLAIEEFKELKQRYKYYMDQKKDIVNAREDIYSVIEDINQTSVEMFQSTFKGIQKNFHEIFRQLFGGGSASVTLVDENNVLESGIEIMVRPPGKKPKSINLLSGGERSLTAIALLFAIYMEKPSPFCFLDEIDAALDEENVSRFMKMVREFARHTQFVIVTHNKKTMSVGENIYGITMEEPGVSRVVSLKLEKVEKKVV